VRRASLQVRLDRPLLIAAIVVLAAVGGLAGWAYLVGGGGPAPGIEVDLIHPHAAPAGESPAEALPEPPSTSEALSPAWQRYARAFPADDARPRIAVVVVGLGIGEAVTAAAVERLPGEITLAFSPYGRRLDNWIAAARAAGHEVMLGLPMEPLSFPRDDPGPQALLTSLAPEENRTRLDWVLGRAEQYVGVVNAMGSRFLASAPHMRPVLEEIARRGLMFLDGRDSADIIAARLASELGVLRAINDRCLDAEASSVAIDGRLEQIERLALANGYAVALAQALPVTIERLQFWAPTLAEKGIALAPITALADRQPDR